MEAFGQVDPAKIGLSLLVALAMGILIYHVYKRFFTGVVYSRSFAVTLGRHVRAYLHGHARDLDERGHLTRYGRCSVNRPLSYGG